MAAKACNERAATQTLLQHNTQQYSVDEFEFCLCDADFATMPAKEVALQRFLGYLAHR